MAKKKKQKPRTLRDAEAELRRVYETLTTVQKDAEEMRLRNGRLANSAASMFTAIDTFLLDVQNMNAKWTVAMKHPPEAPWLKGEGPQV